MKNEYFISFADIKLRILSELPLGYFSTVISDFSYDPVLGYDHTYDIVLCDDILPDHPVHAEPVFFCEVCNIFRGELGEEIRVFRSAYYGGYHFIYVKKLSDALYEMTMSRSCAERMRESYRFINMLCLENLLLDVNGFMLHSVVMKHKDRSILLTAPSGTGKTTHSKLWERLYGTEIVNGDKALIRKNNDTFYAYGSPLTGSSGIGINTCAPIGAIAVLKQAPVNSVTSLNLKDAYTAIYSQSTVNVWSNDFINRITDIVLDLVSSVPVFMLECNMEDEAAHTLYRSVFGEAPTVIR